MDHAVSEYFDNSLAPSTRTAYRAAINRYVTFCHRTGSHIFPLSLSTILRFVAYLASSGVSHGSITSYLSGLRFAQIAVGLPDPQLFANPQIHYVLRGIHRSGTPSSVRRLPITPELLHLLFESWSRPSCAYSRFDCIMLRNS